MKKIILFITSLVISNVAVHADISWSVSSALTDNEGTSLVADPFPVSPLYDGVGFLVQLIWDGGDGIDIADPNVSNGAGGNDVVLDAVFIGSGSGATPGLFGAQAGPEHGSAQTGLNYYIRSWNGASAVDPVNNPDASIPLTSPIGDGSVFYGNSPLFTSTQDPNAAPPNNLITETFSTAGFQTTLQLVPEPGTLALFGLGGFALWSVQRRKRSQAKS